MTAASLVNSSSVRPLDNVLSHLEGVVPVTDHSWKAICPLHDDHTPSLQITEAADGKVLMFCHVCNDKNIGPRICNHFGLPIRTLFPDHGRPTANRNGKHSKKSTKPPPRIVAEYTYRSEAGIPLYQVCRTADKEFPQRKPDGKGGWSWGVKDVRKVLYRLPELLQNPESEVQIHEGEKDVDNAADFGFVATTASSGASKNPDNPKWPMDDDFNRPLENRDVIIFPDNDPAGRAHAAAIANRLQGQAKRVRICTLPGLPPKGDLSDWLDLHDAVEPDELKRMLQALIDAAPDYTPEMFEDVAKKSIDNSEKSQRERLAPGTTVRPKDRDNFGEVASDDGETITVHFVSSEGQEADVEFAPEDLRLQDGRPVVPAELPKVVTIGELIESFPTLREPVIEGVLRQGEICNIIAKSKVGKSWTAYGLALSVVMGLLWFGRFLCRRGRVLLIDNELHPENLAHRIPAVAEKMHIMQSDFHNDLHVCSLRGRLKSILEMKSFFDEIEPGTYSLIIIDALYRMFPEKMSENDNAMMAQIYNALDAYAAATGAAFVIVHHATKGEQGGKDTVDVGSGASAQARAADTHLILRPHESENCVVLDAVVRSFERVEPLVLRWDFPVWIPADDLDPNNLKGTKKAKESEAKQQRYEEKRKRVVDFLGRPECRMQGATQTAIKNGTGISVALLAVLNSLVDDGNLTTCEIVHPKNKLAQPAWKIKPDEAAERLKDGFAGRNSVLQSGSSPSLKDGIPLKGEFRPPENDGLPKSLKDGFTPEDDISNQSAKTGKRRSRKKPKARKSPA